MEYTGNLHKLIVNHINPVQYILNLGKEDIILNDLVGKKLSFNFAGIINCIACGRETKKSYQGGYCFPCTQKLAQCDLCIVRPERCHYHHDTCREPTWGQEHCLTPHIVYIANTSGLKVGITRETNIPMRWIDQGASQALPILRVKTRYQSGLIEVVIAKYIADKTNWRKMLQGEPLNMDLEEERDKLFVTVSKEIQQVATEFEFGDIELLTDEKVIEFSYPVEQYPDKVKSCSLAKTPLIEGKLQGIKGQYLLFDTGVMNIRSHAGYEVVINVE